MLKKPFKSLHPSYYQTYKTNNAIKVLFYTILNFLFYLDFTSNFSIFVICMTKYNMIMNITKEKIVEFIKTIPQRTASFFKNHLIISNLLIMVVVTIILFLGVNIWLKSYTHHNQSITLPNVVNLTIEEAAAELGKYNLRYEITDSLHVDSLAPGVVVLQIPSAHSKVKDGRTAPIFLTINALSPKTVKLPYLVNTSVRQAESQLKNLGFRNIVIRTKASPYKDLVLSVKSNGRDVKSGEELSIKDQIVLYIGAGRPNEYSSASDVMRQDIVEEEMGDIFY